MQALEALAEEELERLWALLKIEYHRDSVSEECRELTLKYIRSKLSVLDEDSDFIKELTKAGTRIIFDSDLNFPGLDELLEKLYKFNLEGVQRIKSGYLKKGFSERRLQSLESHLQAHAGNSAERRLELAEERNESPVVQAKWAEKMYHARINSAAIICDADPVHAAHSYSFAGNAAKKRFELAKKQGEGVDALEKWARRYYRACGLSAKLSLDTEPLHAAYSYAFKGGAAWILFKLTQDISWLKEAYYAYKSSADKSFDKDPRHAAHASSFAGDYARLLFEKTGEIKWAQIAVEYYDRFFAYCDLDPELQRKRVGRKIESRRSNLINILKSKAGNLERSS